MMSLSKRNILGVVIGVAMLGVATPGALAQSSGKPGRADKPAASHQEQKVSAKIGEIAPAFELNDTDGKTVKLSDYKGKIIVLDWFNPDCPVCAMHYRAGTIQNTVTKFADKDVVFLAINSGGAGKQGAGVERNAKAKKEWKVTFPVLLDESGTVGHTYGAKTTPHCYVIDKAGTLVYAGAIDDGAENHRGQIGTVNYVENALNAVLKGETVSPAETKSYGCAVKYGSKS